MGRPISTYPKPCKACGVCLPLDAFPMAGSKGTGRRARCRPCHAAYERAVRLQQAADAGVPFKPRVRADPLSGARVCRSCEQTKPLDQFAKGQRECRACRSVRGARYRTEHADKEADRHRRQYAENRENLLPKHRAWRRAAYARDPERFREERRERWRRLTPDERQAYYARNQEVRALHWSLRRARLVGTKTEPVRRGEIIARDNRTCYLCQATDLLDADIHLDHVIPLARGGTHTYDNIRVACAPCNYWKSDRLLSEL
jgi:5-methylcytosine-specific restriction endonuclease McrA